MTQNNKPHLGVPSDICYCYILVKDEKHYTIGIAGSSKFHEYNINNSETGSGRLIYYRSFPDTVSALGFKLLIENLAPNSIEYIIRRSNPKLKTLELSLI